MQIPDFQLPSNKEIIVRMREATVSDAIDFSGLSEHMEEAATTLFLDRLQDKAKWTNPKDWTAEDRRFALFWYWLNTEKDHDIALTFDCPVCGEQHTQLINYRQFADTYKPIEGRPEREREFQGKKITVKPINGAGMEALETLRTVVSLSEAEHGKDSGQARQARTRLALTELVLMVRWEDEPKENGQAIRERRIEQMTITDFQDFATTVYSALAEMKHGLDCEVTEGKVVLLSQPIKCPNRPQEVGTRLRVPFRIDKYIPRIV